MTSHASLQHALGTNERKSRGSQVSIHSRRGLDDAQSSPVLPAACPRLAATSRRLLTLNAPNERCYLFGEISPRSASALAERAHSEAAREYCDHLSKRAPSGLATERDGYRRIDRKSAAFFTTLVERRVTLFHDVRFVQLPIRLPACDSHTRYRIRLERSPQQTCTALIITGGGG